MYHVSILVYIHTENYHINHIASLKNRRSSQQTAGPEVLDLHCNPHASPGFR